MSRPHTELILGCPFGWLVQGKYIPKSEAVIVHVGIKVLNAHMSRLQQHAKHRDPVRVSPAADITTTAATTAAITTMNRST